jgi:hypothetical protein
VSAGLVLVFSNCPHSLGGHLQSAHCIATVRRDAALSAVGDIGSTLHLCLGLGWGQEPCADSVPWGLA